MDRCKDKHVFPKTDRLGAELRCEKCGISNKMLDGPSVEDIVEKLKKDIKNKAKGGLMAVRAKFTVNSITKYIGEGSSVKLMCIYDNSIPEDQRFCKATPNGTIEMWINNPVALEQFIPGKAFYVDFTPVE